MSVDLVVYRVRVGLFYCCNLKLKGLSCLNTFEYYVWLRILLLRSGTIHPNPGPISNQQQRNSDVTSAIEKYFSLVHYNVQSALHKIDILSSELKSFDVLAFTETWFSENTDASSIAITGYHPPLRKDRVQDNHGGVAVYINDSFAFRRRPELELPNLECVWCELFLKKRRLLIGVFYRPPSSSIQYLNLIEDSIALAADSDVDNIIVTGDFNYNMFQDSARRKIVNLCRQANLNQLINEPTHFTELSNSLLDLLMVSNTDNVIMSGVGEPFLEQNTRFHCPIFCVLNFSKHQSSSFKRQIWRYNDGDFDAMRECIQTTNWDNIFNGDVDAVSINITCFISSLCTRFIPHKTITVRQSQPPWFHNDLRKIIRRRKRAYDRAKSSNSPTHWTAYKKIRNESISLLRKSKQSYTENLAEKLQSDNLCSSDWWKILKSFISGPTSSSIPALKIGDSYTNSDEEKADVLNSFFVSQTHLDDIHREPLAEVERLTHIGLRHLDVSPNEVCDVLSNLEVGKAAGPDGINNIVLKHCATQLSVPLSRLFNLSLSSGIFPGTWKEANVTPIYKKNDPADPSNYRPISLLSTVGKTMEKVIHKHLFNYLRDNSLLSPLQSGFVPGDSTVNQLVDIYNTFCKAMDDGLEVRAIFCDISKAFDRVWHKGIISKLHSVGIRGSLLSWFSSYLDNRKQRVVLPRGSSTWQTIKAGVPQGSILGPILFLIYINDITQDIGSSIRLFADDTTLYIIIDDPIVSAQILEDDMQKISNWADKWLVTFNPTKTESLLLSRKTSRPYHPPVFMNNHAISEVESHKHLGLTFDKRLSWHSHIDIIMEKAWKRIHIMRKLKFILDRASLQTIYFSFIRPVLEYADVVWNNCTTQESNELDKIQNEAARIVTGATKLISINNLYQETGWELLSSRRSTHKLVLFYKMVNRQVPDYLSDLVPNSVGSQSRYSLRNERNLQAIACKTSLYANSFLPSTINQWNSLPDDIKHSPTLNIFKSKLKKRTKIPNYYCRGSRYGQVLLTRLRNNCSGLKQDLYTKNISDTPLCTCGSVEDVHHFFFRCPLYTRQRQFLFERISTFCTPNLALLLHGDANLSVTNLATLLDSVHTYIIKTKRFTRNNDTSADSLNTSG